MTRPLLLIALIVIISVAAMAGIATSAYSMGYTTGSGNRPGAKCDQLSAQFTAALMMPISDVETPKTKLATIDETRTAYRQACP
jgi:hypothetical protein